MGFKRGRAVLANRDTEQQQQRRSHPPACFFPKQAPMPIDDQTSNSVKMWSLYKEGIVIFFSTDFSSSTTNHEVHHPTPEAEEKCTQRSRKKFIPPLPPKPATPPPPATTPPPPATTELPARKYDKVRHLNQLGKKLIYGNTYHVLVVGEDDFSTTKRLARDFGGTGNLWAANFWATSEHPAGSDQVKRRDAREWIKLLTDAGASIGFSIPALSIATNDWVRGRNPNDAESTVPLRCFDRVVFYQPRLDYRLLGCFLFEARRVLKKAGLVHLLSRPANPDQPAKSPHLTWPLETLGSENGLVCSMQIEIPWGGEKHNRPWTLVVFTLPVPVVPVEENSKV